MIQCTFEQLQKICKYFEYGVDENRRLENTCRKPSNIPQGSSWGECCEDKCPLLKDKSS